MSSKNAKRKYPKSTTTLNSGAGRATSVLGGIVVLAFGVLVIGGVLWKNHRSEPHTGVQNAAVEVTIEDDGVVQLGRPDTGTVIDLFEDPLCPSCAVFEDARGTELLQAVDDGTLEIRYHVLDFLNQLSASGDYSTRAAAAAQCVAETGDAAAYSAFHAALFSSENQPEENGSADHTNAELAQIAQEAGASDAAVQCITSGTKVADAATHAEAARHALAATGATGTPTVVRNGTVIDPFSDDQWVPQS
ncbi:DsbA family protein [Rhodococcus koreensis]